MDKRNKLIYNRKDRNSGFIKIDVAFVQSVELMVALSEMFLFVSNFKDGRTSLTLFILTVASCLFKILKSFSMCFCRGFRIVLFYNLNQFFKNYTKCLTMCVHFLSSMLALCL